MSQETSETKNVKKGGIKKLLIIVLIVIAVLALVVTVTTVVSTVYLREAGGRELEVSTPPQDANPLYKMFGPLDFTVNLLDTDQRRYLKVMVTLGYEDKALAKELEQRKAQVRDTIINVLRNQRVDDVLDINGTDNLRRVMINELNAVLSRGEIKDIYFTDFLIQ